MQISPFSIFIRLVFLKKITALNQKINVENRYIFHLVIDL